MGRQGSNWPFGRNPKASNRGVSEAPRTYRDVKVFPEHDEVRRLLLAMGCVIGDTVESRRTGQPFMEITPQPPSIIARSTSPDITLFPGSGLEGQIALIILSGDNRLMACTSRSGSEYVVALGHSWRSVSQHLADHPDETIDDSVHFPADVPAIHAEDSWFEGVLSQYSPSDGDLVRAKERMRGNLPELGLRGTKDRRVTKRECLNIYHAIGDARLSIMRTLHRSSNPGLSSE